MSQSTTGCGLQSRVSLPDTLLHPSIFSTTLMHAVFFSRFSRYHREGSPGRGPPLPHLYKFASRYRDHRHRGVRTHTRAHLFTFSSARLPARSVRSSELLSHDDRSCRFLKASCTDGTSPPVSCSSVTSHFQEKRKTNAARSVILRSVVAAVCTTARACACVCARGAPARRAAPSPLFVTLVWNAYARSLHC